MFITIEGIDGAGKSTVVEALSERFDAVTTCEPSEHWTGPVVRRGLSDDETAPLTDFFLFMADRVNHIENTIRPALEAGETVISDRYADSTLAYQSHALREQCKAPERYMESLMEPWNLEPDLTLYINISVDTALERCDQGDKYENREFIQAAKDNYDRLVRPKNRVVTIDGEQPPEKVVEDCLRVVSIFESGTVCEVRDYVQSRHHQNPKDSEVGERELSSDRMSPKDSEVKEHVR